MTALTNRTRFAKGHIQEMTTGGRLVIHEDTAGALEDYSFNANALNWRFRSGDRVQYSVTPTGDRLIEPFEVSDGVIVPPGSYDWWRQAVSLSTAQKRRFYTSISYEWGSFYDGDLDVYQLNWTWNPTALFTVEFNSERNIASLVSGSFNQTLIGSRLRVNFSPDLSLASYTQYDTVTDSIGVNAQVRWTYMPAGDLFVVYNHNVRSLQDRWELQSNQLLVKLQYRLSPIGTA